MFLFKNVNLITENDILPCELLVGEGKILKIGEAINAENAEAVDCGGCYLSAGLIDLHCHGGGGFSAMGNADEILGMADAHLKNGVTSILPTSLAADLDTLDEVIENTGKAQRINPNILGVHLEGPFLSPEMCGAQNTDCLSVPAKTDYRPFFEKNRDIIKMVGVAPELDGAMELGEYLKEKGVTVSLAHSAGDYGTAKKALEHGFSDITHIYNACTSCYKEGAFRKAGTVEAGLSLDGYTVQAIADLKHLPEGLLELIYKCKGADKMYLISDALEFAASDIKEGETVVQKNGVEAVFCGGAMLTADKSKLAGSIASGIELVKNMYENTSATLPEAVRMMTLTPAKIIGIDNSKGRLAEGYDADVIAFDKSFNIKLVMKNGEIIINKCVDK